VRVVPQRIIAAMISSARISYVTTLGKLDVPGWTAR
jgi:hypothetical protein